MNFQIRFTKTNPTEEATTATDKNLAPVISVAAVGVAGAVS